MEHKTSFIMVFISRIGVALAILFVALPAVGAQSPEAKLSMETQGTSSAATSEPGVYFIHTVTAANIADNYTFIDHPLTNNNPNAILIVTQNWSPGGTGGGYNPSPIGVWYSNSAQKWAVFNQDLASMYIGLAFNVLIPAAGTNVFIHTATIANIANNYTYLDHPLTNNNPNAIVLVTQNWNPGGTGGTYNDHPIGVWYSSSTQKWAVFNQDIANMPAGAAFNVLIPATAPNVFVHTATADNTTSEGLGTLIDHPLTNNNPNAIVFATQNWNPGGGSGTYNTFPIGVSYSFYSQKWAVMPQTVISIPLGASFNVIVMPSKVYLPLVLGGN